MQKPPITHEEQIEYILSLSKYITRQGAISILNSIDNEKK